MKALTLVSLLTLTACSSNRVQDTIPPFSKEKVCSDESLAYLERSSAHPHLNEKVLEEEIYPRMLSLEPSIRKCYEDEMERTGKYHSFNLCFVAGYSSRGEMDYFEFSTHEIELSKEFKTCLSELRGRKELIGFKYVSIVQPFRLHSKK